MMKAQTDRQYYVDWLRVGAMFLLIFFHTAMIFNVDPWQIKNAVLYPAVNIFTGFLGIWQMPLFFILAGASVWFSLGKRTPGQFVNERLLRLLVPLIFGMLILVPPQLYYERVLDGDFAGSFLAWYPHTFHGIYSVDNAATGNWSWHHLWFLAYLFVFSMILLPAFSYFRKEATRPLITRVVDFLSKPGAIFLLTIPLIIINITLRPLYGWGNQNLVNDWANFLFYITIFFYGFWLVLDCRMIQVAQRNRYITLAVASILSLATYLIYAQILPLPGAVWLSLWAIACFCWLLTFTGIGSLALNFTNRVLSYASDAVLPVYIVHQTVIVVFGFYVIQWNIPDVLKFFLIAFVTLLGSLAMYEVIKRFNVTRFLFGMKIKRKSKAVPATAA